MDVRGIRMRCGHCGGPVDLSDNYCRRCGEALNRRDLPTVTSRSLLPVPWEVAKGPVMRGVAGLVVATVAEILRREVARQVSSPEPSNALAVMAAGKPASGKNGRFPWSKAPKGEYEVTETIIQRRVRWFKR